MSLHDTAQTTGDLYEQLSRLLPDSLVLNGVELQKHQIIKFVRAYEYLYYLISTTLPRIESGYDLDTALSWSTISRAVMDFLFITDPNSIEFDEQLPRSVMAYLSPSPNRGVFINANTFAQMSHLLDKLAANQVSIVEHGDDPQTHAPVDRQQNRLVLLLQGTPLSPLVLL